MNIAQGSDCVTVISLLRGIADNHISIDPVQLVAVAELMLLCVERTQSSIS